MGKNFDLKKAVIFCVLASISMSVMGLLVKITAQTTSNNMIIFFRFGISFIYVLGVLSVKKRSGVHITLKTNHFWIHFLRAFAGMMGMLFFYYSLKFITLVDATLLMRTNALFVPILAIVFLGSRTNFKTLCAILLGFLGVVLIIRPEVGVFDPMAIYALLGGLSSAVSISLVRKLSVHDSTHTSLFYYFTFAFIMSGIISIFNWRTPDLHVLLLLLGVGVLGTAYQEFLYRASANASAKIVTPLLYLNVIFSAILQWLVWKEIPDAASWIGFLLVLAGGTLIITFASNKNNSKKSIPPVRAAR